MKKVRMLKTESGSHPEYPTPNRQYKCRTGQVYVVPDQLADKWVKIRLAELVTNAKTATGTKKNQAPSVNVSTHKKGS